MISLAPRPHLDANLYNAASAQHTTLTRTQQTITTTNDSLELTESHHNTANNGHAIDHVQGSAKTDDYNVGEHRGQKEETDVASYYNVPSSGNRVTGGQTVAYTNEAFDSDPVYINTT